VIAALLLGAAATQPGRFPAVRLRGARIAGRLDMMGATLSCALVCEHCWVDTAPRFVEATTKTVRFVDSSIAGFNGTRMRVEGILNLYRTKVATIIRLDGATVAGEVCMREAVIGQAQGESVAARGLTVDADLDCREMISHGPVELVNARISGSVYLTGAKISWHGSPALDASNAIIGAGVDSDRMAVDGETRLRHTRVVGSLRLAAAQLDNPGGTALGAGGLSVQGGTYCHRIAATGEMRFVGARLEANLTLTEARLGNRGGVALNLDRATLADVDATGMTVTAGSVRVIGAEIAGRLNLTEMHLNSGHGTTALDASGTSIGRRWVLTRAHISGQVRAHTTKVASRIWLAKARIENPGDMALQLTPIDVAFDVICDQMAVLGCADFTGAKIGGHLDLRRTRLINPGSTALIAHGVQVAQASIQPAEPIQGTVDLSHARIGVLRDDPQTWPTEILLGGLTYEALEPQLPARQRLNWLARDPGSQSPPYEQLAAYYTRTGWPAAAREVLYATERRQRASKTLPGRVWSLLQDVTVGYGYRPARAAAWLAVLLAAGSITYALAPPAPLNTGGAPHFNPLIYTLDLLLPVVNLGQKYAFNPAGAEQWLSYLLVAAGWVLATTIATSAARIISRR
jgi:adhesin HecA-like repeat protein